jgi:hypothetical protein
MRTPQTLAVIALMAAGCAPRAGVLRPSHPWLGADAGGDRLSAASRSAPLFDDPVPSDDDQSRSMRARIAETAGAVVGSGPVVVGRERFRMDCSGVARGIYAKAGARLGTVRVAGQTNDTRVLFELTRQTGSLRRSHPLVGDLVFFDDTYDQNKNGLTDDPLSHVGVVERVESDGTVVLVHRIGSRIVRARMNLDFPHDRYDAAGRPLNHFLRAAEGGRPAKTTAELFVAFGSLPVTEPSRLARR